MKKGQHPSQISKSFLKLSESKKYPRLFKLKTAALLVVVLIAIVGIIDIVFFVYIKNNREPVTNISFVNNIVRTTQVITSADEISQILQNILMAYPATYFQYAEKVSHGTGDDLNLEKLKNQIFADKTKDLLFIFQLKQQDTLQTSKIGLFTAAYFTLPKDNNYNASLEYYTLQGSSGSSSVVFSLEKHQYLVFNQTEGNNILKCKNYIFSETRNSLQFYGIIKKDLLSSNISSSASSDIYKCFHKIESPEQLATKVNDICGLDLVGQELAVVQYEVYHLTNDKKMETELWREEN